MDIEAALTSAGARLLVVAPHPDDESLATGGLLQRAQARGAAVKVVLVTDGDNNPWPQRWLERRWRISADDRTRWGQRRRGETHAAMAALGLPATAPVCLGWPDLGVTERLLAQPEASVQMLAAVIGDFAPSVLVFPSLGDSHPDHSACHVLVQLALRRLAVMPAWTLTYLVHGQAPTGAASRLVLPAEDIGRKRSAVLAYQTQVSLSRGRLLANVSATETYFVDAAETAGDASNPWAVPVPLRRVCQWLIVAGEQTWRQPWVGPLSDAALLDSVAAGAAQRLDADAPVFVKLRSTLRSPWIFDHWGWRCLRRLTPGSDSAKLGKRSTPANTTMAD